MATKMNPAFKAMIEKKKADAKPAAKGKPFAKGGMTKMGAVKTSSKPDGIAVKGKTKGTMVTMKRGGKTC